MVDGGKICWYIMRIWLYHLQFLELGLTLWLKSCLCVPEKPFMTLSVEPGLSRIRVIASCETYAQLRGGKIHPNNTSFLKTFNNFDGPR